MVGTYLTVGKRAKIMPDITVETTSEHAIITISWEQILLNVVASLEKRFRPTRGKSKNV